jgi:release factor glutamine methyltransferase
MSIIVKEMLIMAENALKDSGCMDPKLDSERLFQYLYNLNNTGLFLMKPKMLNQNEAEKYFDLVDFRISGIPLQYITGSQEFMGLSFKVNESVLIPRQDTETLVEFSLEYIKKADKVKGKHKGEWKVLDLCCGSGVIGISLAHYAVADGKKIKVTALDVSDKAVSVAMENAKKLKVDKYMSFYQGDLFQPLKKRFSAQKFDLIVTNPPYIKTQIIPTLQKEVKDYEPMLALDGGEDGLDFYKAIIFEANQYLKKGGILVMEIGHDQGSDVAEMFDNNENYSKIEVLKDLAGHDRVVILTS